MRQPGDDLRINPHNPIKTQPILPPTQQYMNMQNHNIFIRNAIVFKAHKFCGKTCMDLSETKLNGDEEACMTQCLTKYDDAIGLLAAERKSFENTIDQINLNGGNKFGRIDGE